MSQSQHATQHMYTTNSTYFVRSYAKINLTLDVLGKRPDGYHELATVMQTIDLYDTIGLVATDEDRVSMACNRPDLNNNENLVVRAAQAIREKLGLTRGLFIELYKRVPVAAGLGGGSANAAAVLLALRHWWNLPLSHEELWEIASSLGSDVPFFLTGGLAICKGRGEQVKPLEPHWPTTMRWLLLVKPAISVSTATVFRQLAPQDYSNGSYSSAVEAALQTQRALKPEDLYNGLERGVLAQYPEVEQARQAMLQAGASYVRLSGSGPTLFSTFSNLAEVTQVQQKLLSQSQSQAQAQGYEVHVTRAIAPGNQEMHYF